MSLHTDIKSEAIEAMKARDAVRVSVLRGLLSAFTNESVSKKRRPDEDLSDDEVLTVIQRQVKQRKDSIEQFEKGGRPELAEDERKELVILEVYLPSQMSREEVFEYVKSKQQELGITDKSKSGQLTGMIMKDLKGKADGTFVKEAVDSLLS